MTVKLLILTALITMLSACGSDNTPEQAEVIPLPEPSPSVYTGQFLDSAVMGLNYKTSSQSGQTNVDGEFTFQDNETITFSIGDIELPAVTAKLYLTPLDVFQSNDINQIEVVNLLRLLQSLDNDGDSSNGIEITEASHQLASALNIDFAADNFDQQVADLISQNGAFNQTLISANMAIAHFQLTLNEISNSDLRQCTAEHSMVGYSGFFSTLAHNVSGKATIIDDCTIEVSQFSYDGGGPDVFFYGANDHQYAENDAFAIGPQLNGQPFENSSITIKLPTNKSLDDLNGLSVWCVDFAANFGQMEFTP